MFSLSSYTSTLPIASDLSFSTQGQRYDGKVSYNTLITLFTTVSAPSSHPVDPSPEFSDISNVYAVSSAPQRAKISTLTSFTFYMLSQVHPLSVFIIPSSKPPCQLLILCRIHAPLSDPTSNLPKTIHTLTSYSLSLYCYCLACTYCFLHVSKLFISTSNLFY